MHYNNLVVKVWLKVRLEFIRIQLYLCCIHEKKSGKIFFIREKSGNYQGISFLDFCGHPDIYLMYIVMAHVYCRDLEIRYSCQLSKTIKDIHLNIITFESYTVRVTYLNMLIQYRKR